MAVAIPFVIYGAVSALRSTSNDPRQWLPRTFAETSKYDWFQQHFGSDEIAVVSWPGCTLDDPRVTRLAKSLEESDLFDRALTGPRVLRELMQRPGGLSRTAALRRLRGILVEPGGETTCLIVATSALGRADRIQAVREIERSAAADCGLSTSQLRLAGPTVDAAAIDAESRRLLFQLAGFSALVSFLVASLRLRSIRLAIMILVVAVYSTGLSLAILYFSGSKMNLLMTMLPPLIYVLSISSAVHLANYYRDAISDGSSTSALATAVSHGWLPCLLAAATTAIGLASLVMSKIDPIREFGIFSAVGVIVSLGVLFLLLPSALYLFPPPRQTTSGQSSQGTRLGKFIIGVIGRHYLLVMFSCLALMGFCGWGLPHIKSTVRLQDRFLSGSDAIADYVWLEQHIGPMVPLEVVVHFDKGDPRDTLERIQLVAAMQSKIHSLDEPVTTMSAVNLSPPLPRVSGVRNVIERSVLNRPRTQQRLIDAKFLAETDDEQLWRITVRANAIGDLDYGQFAETLRQRVDPLLQQHGVRGTYTGVIPLIYKAQRQLLHDLFRSFLAAFAVIAVVLVFVLRSLTAALLAMLPNLFPAVVVFGSLQWIDIPVQIGSVMTASAALGIAVDDTVHFLTWFRRGLDTGLSRTAALGDAFGRCAGAMAHTTLICSSGLLVFAASSFVPILHFAWLMVFLLLSALIGDLVLLPAILAGPLGRCFESAKRSSAAVVGSAQE
jgi:predicted RND superfamily exporter protein